MSSLYGPKPGCPMCGIVASSSAATTCAASEPQVVWRDDNFTAYREQANPVSSKGHFIIAFNLHVPSLYTLSSTDLPLLVSVRQLAIRLLSEHSNPQYSSPQPGDQPSSPLAPSSANPHADASLLSSSSSSFPLASSSTSAQDGNHTFHIGFITPPFKDTKIPVTDHLHAHAYIAPADLLGWWRGIAYSGLAWYEMDDLIAEIRESVSNNRVKSGYESRKAPIDSVPTAGARAGHADGTETTEPGLANSAPTIEDGGISSSIGEGLPLGRPRTPTLVP